MKAIYKSVLSLAWAVMVVQTGYSQQVPDSTAVQQLDEVVVTASNISRNATGYTIRLADNPITTAKNTKELLNYLPNVSVVDGTITINGMAASEIYIDGRKLTNQAELEVLSAEMIESVRIEYNSGVGQLTNSLGGTIHIKLKRAPSAGYYGSLKTGLSAGRRQGAFKEFVDGVVCARIGNLSIYESPYGSWLDYKEWMEQTFVTPENTTFASTMRGTKRRQFYNALSLNYEINSAHNIGLSWTYDNSNVRNPEYDESRSEQIFHSRDRSIYNYLTAKYVGNFTARDKLTLDAEWLNLDYRLRQTNLNETAALANNNSNQVANTLEFRAEYSHRFSDKYRLITGATYRWRDIDTKKFAGTDMASATSVQLGTPLVFGSFEGTAGNLNYQVGLNWKMHRLKVASEKPFRQNSVNPTINFTLPWGQRKSHSLTVTYKHLMYDIPYDAITEQPVWMDAYNYTIGNRSLKAPSDHYVNVMLGLCSNTFNISFDYFRETNDIVWQTFAQGNAGINYTKPMNISPVNRYALRVEFNKRWFGAWTFKAVGRLALNTENETFGHTRYHTTRLRQFYQVANSVRLKKGWGGSLNFFIEPTFRTFERTYHTVYQMDVSIYKTFMDNYLQIIADCRPFERRRVLDRRADGIDTRLKYTTPILGGSLRVVWYFRGGKKDIDVNINEPTLDYQQTRDNL